MLNYEYDAVDLSMLSTEVRDLIEPTLDCFAFACHYIGMQGPTSKNIDEFIRRYRLYTHASTPATRWLPWTEKFIREFLVDKYHTNAKTFSKTAFDKFILELIAEDANHTPLVYVTLADGYLIKRFRA